MGFRDMVTRYVFVSALFCCTVLFSFSARAQETKLPLTYSLDECIHIAQRQSPAILAAAEEMKRTKGVIWETWANILSVNADATFTYFEQSPTTFIPANAIAPGIPSADIDISPGADKSYNVGVEGTVPLFSGGRVISGIAVAYLSNDIAYEQYRQAINDTLYNVRVAFYSIVLAREVVKVRADALDLLTRQLDITKKKYDVGVVSKFDLLRAEVEVANARPPLIQAQNDLTVAGESLKRILGIDVDEPFDVEGDLTFSEESVDLDRMIAEADVGSPELTIARKSEKIAGKQVNMAVGSFLPTISAVARYDGTTTKFSWNERRLGLGLHGGGDRKRPVDGPLYLGRQAQAGQRRLQEGEDRNA